MRSDVDGNRSTKIEGGVTTSYFYDESNKLIRVEQPTGTVISRYGYDPFERRLWKEVGGQRTYFYYDEDGLAAELDAAGNPTKTYLFPPDGLYTTAPLAMKSGGAY
jgi:YD repeat-containing protein